MKPQNGMLTSVKYEKMNSRKLQVIEILRKVLGESDLWGDLSRQNPKWDSLKQLQISIELEDYFGIELSDEQAVQFFDVNSILELLDKVIENGS